MGRLELPAWNISQAGDFEPIVSAELFSQVQAVLGCRRGMKLRHHRENPDFPLRRFVRCGSCSTPLTGSWSRGRSSRHPYYHCTKCGIRFRRAELEADFVSLLERLTPSADVTRLFNAIVRDAWAERRQASSKALSIGKARLTEVRRRLDLLEEAFVFRKEIDQESYVSLRDHLREQLTSTELLLEDVAFGELDVETAIAASDHVLGNSAVLWQNGNLDQRRRLQSALLPGGISHDGHEFGTAVTPIVFSGLQEDGVRVDGMASPT